MNGRKNKIVHFADEKPLFGRVGLLFNRLVKRVEADVAEKLKELKKTTSPLPLFQKPPTEIKDEQLKSVELNIKVFKSCVRQFIKIQKQNNRTVSGFLRSLASGYLSFLNDEMFKSLKLLALINEIYETAIVVHEKNQLAWLEFNYFQDEHMGFLVRHGFNKFRVPDYEVPEFKKVLDASGVIKFLNRFIEAHLDQLLLLCKEKIPKLIPKLLYELAKDFDFGNTYCLNFEDKSRPMPEIGLVFVKGAAKLGHKEAIHCLDTPPESPVLFR